MKTGLLLFKIRKRLKKRDFSEFSLLNWQSFKNLNLWIKIYILWTELFLNCLLQIRGNNQAFDFFPSELKILSPFNMPMDTEWAFSI